MTFLTCKNHVFQSLLQWLFNKHLSIYLSIDDDKMMIKLYQFKNHTLAWSTFADFHEGRVIHTNTKKEETFTYLQVGQK